MEFLALAGVLVFLWWRAEKVLLPLVTQKMEEKGKPVGPTPEPMPQDLRLLAYSYQDEWAREQAEKTMQELYQQYGEWDDVRAALRNNQGLI